LPEDQTIDLLRSGRRGEEAAEFWRRLHSGRLAIQRCTDCGSFRFPPGSGCPSCGSVASVWTEPATEPELVAWTITHAAAADRMPARLASWIPYALVLVRFPDVDNVLLPAFLEGETTDPPVAGARVVLTGGPPERPRLTAELASP
jgi:uncharacterized protein